MCYIVNCITGFPYRETSKCRYVFKTVWHFFNFIDWHIAHFLKKCLSNYLVPDRFHQIRLYVS